MSKKKYSNLRKDIHMVILFIFMPIWVFLIFNDSFRDWFGLQILEKYIN